jgi:hypothetical protein
MPYKISMQDGRHCVIKEEDGKRIACHDTHAEAMAQMRAIYASEGKGAEEGKQRDASVPLTLWKDKTGRYRFICSYSNKWRDQDLPVPEIISSTAHKDFIERVDKGMVPYPELWHWHMKSTAWGQTDWLCLTDEGFALASGYILPGHEKEAEIMLGMKGIRTSHGMPYNSIERDAKDSSIITRYDSVEISDLPAHVAANMLTDFQVLEVETMIPQQKKEYLKTAGLSDEAISRIETTLEGKALAADTLGLDSKEASAETAPIQEEVKVEEVKAVEPVVVEQVVEPVVVQEVKETPVYATNDDVKALVEIITVAATSIKALTDRMTALEANAERRIKEQEKKESESPTPTSVPMAFLKDLMKFSPIGALTAEVKGNDALTRGPKEAKDTTKGRTGIPFLDALTAPVAPNGEQ